MVAIPFTLILLIFTVLISVFAGVLADKTARPHGDRKTGYVLVGTGAVSAIFFCALAMVFGISMSGDDISNMLWMVVGGYATLTALIATGMYSHRYKTTLKQQNH